MFVVSYFLSCCVITALLAYDCGGSAGNITSVSLLGTGDCVLPSTTPNKTETYIQLLQLTDYEATQVYQCRVEIDRTIYYCGMSSHVSVVNNGRRIYIMDVSAEVCKNTINTGTLALTSFTILTGLRVNSTEFRSITLSGSVEGNGKCSGTQYADSYGTWDNVVVQDVVRVDLKTYSGIIKIKDNVISLRGHVQCVFTDGRCLTDENGSAFWTPFPELACDFRQYTALYEGTATKIVSTTVSKLPSTMYTVTKGETTFALLAKSERRLCGYTLIKTEHPKLFILETQRGKVFKGESKIAPENVDLFTYMNTKFVYIENHNRERMESLYMDVLLQRCKLERQILETALALATIHPDIFAYTIMKSAGYMAVIGGEVAHVIKCTPVSVKIRHSERCYRELPVTYQNKSMFLRPKSRTLVSEGTIELCSALLPQEYLIEGIWYQMSPKPTYVRDPHTLEPNTEVHWMYTDAGSLATSGIYAQTDLDNLRDHIMFPVEGQLVLNTIARGAAGQSVPVEKLNLLNVVSDQELNNLTKNVASRMWNSLLEFGTIPYYVDMPFIRYMGGAFTYYEQFGVP